MIYLKNFSLLDEIEEHKLYQIERRNIFNNYYPLQFFMVEMVLEKQL